MASTVRPARSRPRWRRFLKISAQVGLGLGLGLALAEVAFSMRDGGAFPHVNFYLPDPELGVRLEPGASMQFQLRPNPAAAIHVNSRGFRGPDWPAPADGEVIVVGDSQVFGLGVADDATFSAQLSQLPQAAGRAVINAGVPTYGPMEYLATARELLAERKASTVVVVLNFVNDPFEIDRPNRDRHAVWDGWAVRSETAPASVTEFPGRKWLFSKSHLVYTLRRWLHERGTLTAPEGSEAGNPVDLGTPSEGGLDDLVLASHSAHQQVETDHQTAVAALAGSRARLGTLDEDIEARRNSVDDKLRRISAIDEFELEIARGRPGDIVRRDYGESGRSVQVTAELIRKAARARAKFIEAALKEEARLGKSAIRELVTAEADLIAEQQRLRLEIAAGVPPPSRPPSRFHDYLIAFKKLCDEYGAELVVGALPIDVQVDPGEWTKYGVSDPPDMRDSLILLDDLVADAHALGLRALDATASLRAAQPGAFLDHDIHMTAKGHAALAAALAETLAAAPPAIPLRVPDPGLPVGRSFVPTAGEWATAPEVLVKGSTALGCSTQIEREWLRVQCRRRSARDRFAAVVVSEGETPATMAMPTVDSLSLVTPLTIGEPVTARFAWAKDTHELQIRWPEGEDGKPKFVGEFLKVITPPEAPPAHEAAAAIAALCACHRQATGETLCAEQGSLNEEDSYASDCNNVCSDLWGDFALLAACTGAYPGDDQCAPRIACAQNDPLFAPTCPEGHVHAFASNRCFAVCDDRHPCAAGSCQPWQGGGVCR